MLCAVCYGVLRGHKGSQWRGTFDLHFDHQLDEVALRSSAAEPVSCCICRSILGELSFIENDDSKSQNNRMQTLRESLYKLISKWIWGELKKPKAIDAKDRAAFISAYLSELRGLEAESNGVTGTFIPKIYRLDFKLRGSERVGTFVLEQIGAQPGSVLHTAFSENTSSDEVLEIAKTWINRCTSEAHPACPNEPSGEQLWYPSRLIDLGSMVPVVARKEVRDDPPQVAENSERRRKDGNKKDSEYVRLVSKDEEHRMQGFYVTLSHCWGDAKFAKLTEDNMAEFKKGIHLKDLPKTFEHAIRFARRLGNKSGQVRYIWIDSLCIIQATQPDKPTEVQKADWLKESAQMHMIYNNSYCNISASAASDSTKGLFLKREPHLLWEDEINLNTEGIPGSTLTPSELIQRCKIIDLSFWERNIDDAPVNRRAWVLQERLMAPRVLHFCRDQIAWECRKVDASESFRDGIASFRLRSGEIESAERLKSFVPVPTPGSRANPSAEHRLATYHHWKSVVERYSKTKLKQPGDKLIALSGIAKLMSGELPNVDYVAGLWNEYLESQLLWRVDPVFESGQFSFLSKRSPIYRSPSFSWAAIDSQRGIAYGDFTTENILIKIETFEMFQDKGADKFGLVKEGCFIEISGVVKSIILEEREDQSGIRYCWDLKGNARESTGHTNKLDDQYSIVYLDSPLEDKDILGEEGRMYCLPARQDHKGYLICLLLQQDLQKEGQYRRVGMTKIPRYDQIGQKRVYDPERAQDKPVSFRLV